MTRSNGQCRRGRRDDRQRKPALRPASEEAAAEASEEVTTTVGGLTKEDIKTMFKDIADAMREGFGTCLKEIKYLSERVEAVEKKVGITTKRKGTSSQNTTSPPKPTLEPGSESVNGTNAGRKSLPEDKGPDVPADASSSKDKAPEPSLVLLDKNQPTFSDLQKEDARYQAKRDAALAFFRAKSDRTRKLVALQQSPYTANSTAKVIIPNKKLYPGYNLFAPIDKKKLKELADWLKTCPHYRTPLDKKPRTSRTCRYHILRTSLEWLEDFVYVEDLPDDLPVSRLINVLRKRYDANPQHFRSERMCFLDHFFAQQWIFNYKDFKDSEPDQNGLGRRLPGGAWNYYAGTIPSFCQSNKVWGTDIDDVYAPVNYTNTHWIAMWISIPKRHIVVWDTFVPVSPQKNSKCLEPFTYERLTNIPQARDGDCGVYALKYIECHALEMSFSKKDFAKPNKKTMRDKISWRWIYLKSFLTRMSSKIRTMMPTWVFWKTKHWTTNLKVFWKKKPWTTNFKVFWTNYLKVFWKTKHWTTNLKKEDARYQEKRDAALAVCRAKSDRTRKLAASQQSPYTANNTAKVIIPNKKLYPGYNPFAPIDKKKLKELADWLKTCPHYRIPIDKKPCTSRTWWYHILQTSLEWPEDCHIDAWINVLRKRYHANPQHFRSERMCFLDHLFFQQWRFNYKDFRLGARSERFRKNPGGAWNYHAGIITSFCQSNKVWRTDIDDIYAPVNYNDSHWIVMCILIPKRHIVVFDSICSSISPEELDVIMEHFLYMVPYLLVECASSDE
ncbi:hypothetical protein F2Q68_00021880 [Brassica cretica]|nr:hypothetical protein F2Q68_00021880 [Brassica cretica]